MSQATFSHKSICILRLSSIGDITHMIPIIKSIQSYTPKTDITWIIGKTEYSLVKNISNVHFIVIDKKDFLSTFSTLIYLYKNFRFDILLNMQVSLRANIISLFIKAKIKVGFDKHNSKNLHGFFINTRINNSVRKHVRETFFEFLTKIGIKERSDNTDINIEYKIDERLIKKKYIVFNPFTSSRNFNYREWDINNYKIIANYISKNYDINSVMVGGNTEYEMSQSRKLESENSIINLVGKTDLQELYNILRACELYIGPDSGTLHIASILNRPVIGLYATSNPNRTGPIDNMDNIINKYPLALQKYHQKKIDQVKWGKRIREPNAMKLINIDEVVIKINKILKA